MRTAWVCCVAYALRPDRTRARQHDPRAGSSTWAMRYPVCRSLSAGVPTANATIFLSEARSCAAFTSASHCRQMTAAPWPEPPKIKYERVRKPIRLLPAVRAEVVVRSGCRPFHMAQWVQPNSVVANRRLSLASNRQEQSIFFQPSNILCVMK